MKIHRLIFKKGKKTRKLNVCEIINFEFLKNILSMSVLFPFVKTKNKRQKIFRQKFIKKK